MEKPYELEAQGLNEADLDLWRRLDVAQQSGDVVAISAEDAKGLHALILRLNSDTIRLRACLGAKEDDVLNVKYKGAGIAALVFFKACDEGNRGRLRELLADHARCEPGELRKAVLPLFMEMNRQKFHSVTVTRDGSKCLLSARLEGDLDQEAQGGDAA